MDSGSVVAALLVAALRLAGFRPGSLEVLSVLRAGMVGASIFDVCRANARLQPRRHQMLAVPAVGCKPMLARSVPPDRHSFIQRPTAITTVRLQETNPLQEGIDVRRRHLLGVPTFTVNDYIACSKCFSHTGPVSYEARQGLVTTWRHLTSPQFLVLVDGVVVPHLLSKKTVPSGRKKQDSAAHRPFEVDCSQDQGEARF